MRVFGKRKIGGGPSGGPPSSPTDWTGRVAEVLAAIGRRIDAAGYDCLPIEDKTVWNGASMIESLTNLRAVDGSHIARHARPMYYWNGAIAFARIEGLGEVASIATRIRDLKSSQAADEAANLTKAEREATDRTRWDQLTALMTDWGRIEQATDLDGAMRRFVARNYPH